MKTTAEFRLTGLRIWDGVADDYAETDSLQIRSGKLVESAGQPPEMDLSGLTAIPGLIDAHIHLVLDPEISNPLAQPPPSDATAAAMQSRASAMLAAGITAARDLGGGAWQELQLRDRIRSGEVPGPTLFCAGQPITSAGGHCHFWGGEATGIEEVDAVIDRQLAKGADLLKVMATGGSITRDSDPSRAQFELPVIQHLVQRARAADKTVAAHCHGVEGIYQAAEAGVTTIEHCSWVNAEGWGRGFDMEVANSMASRGIYVSPTISSGWKRFMKNPGFTRLIQDNYAGMRAAGIRLIASTDAGIPGVKHDDLPEALLPFAHFAGLSPVETLRAATSDCAAAIGAGAYLGQLAPGFQADLLLLEGDPLQDLSTLAKPACVMQGGNWVQRA